MVKDSFSNLSS